MTALSAIPSVHYNFYGPPLPVGTQESAPAVSAALAPKESFISKSAGGAWSVIKAMTPWVVKIGVAVGLAVAAGAGISWLIKVIPGAVGAALQKAGTFVAGGVGSMAAGAADKVTTGVSSLWHGAKDTFMSVANAAADKLDTLVYGPKTAMNFAPITDFAQNLGTTVQNGLPVAGRFGLETLKAAGTADVVSNASGIATMLANGANGMGAIPNALNAATTGTLAGANAAGIQLVPAAKAAAAGFWNAMPVSFQKTLATGLAGTQ